MKHHRRTKPVIKDLFEDRKISITGFAGCGGADLGVKAATGHEPAIAINHDPVAIAVFADNFESTECYRADVFELDMLRACRGRAVRHLHVSPDCRDHSRHFSRAAGAAPKSDSVRSLADVVGPENELHVSNAMKHAHALVFAWGSVQGPDKPFHEGLMCGLARRNNAMPLCLGTTKTGAPRHPLYVSYETALKPWQPGWR